AGSGPGPGVRPTGPGRAASRPCLVSQASVAAARQVAWAIVAPVTKPPPVPAGSPSSSVTQRSATPLSTEAAGDITDSAAFWSQTAVSQAAACATGSAPPVTQPQYLRPPLATGAGEPASSSRGSPAAAARP